MRAPGIRAVGLLSGWGPGVASLPQDAALAARGRAVLAVERPALDPDRFRRSRRECLMGVAAVHAMLEDAGEGPEAIAGERTALLYATVAAYAPSNREFIEARGGSVYFPYTAGAAVPAETAIAFGLTGPYEILVGGAPATMRAIARAAVLLETGACDRALVLAVEVFEECADLFARAPSAFGAPLVEAAACAWLEPGEGLLTFGRRRGRPRDPAARPRLGEMLACEPLAMLGLGRDTGDGGPTRIEGAWRGELARLEWSDSPYRTRPRAA
ncbi:MAG TPA: beta-ketoacyl synthase N-terminal-like domain-containing protein [Candidatus Bathyarchaeia archaeon]|nr:beta-ketoacyl synthase N-terminal-like domain-containing protein [Candidatus Bathyarchaeia archaeon]